MPIHALDELHNNSRQWTVQVYVSRLWHHRGATDDGPIKHTDIVFQDTQGNHMYGEIPKDLVEQYKGRLQEGRVYELRRFSVGKRKFNYRPVEGQFIIWLGKYTTVQEIPDRIMDFPLCTYALTPIDRLPAPTDLPTSFTDVLGIITGVTQAIQFHNVSRSTPSTKRIIYLSDLSGFEIGIVLWGERALAFNKESVIRASEKGPVIALFVGTLVKPFDGRRGLSGSAPCRWYINEDLPEMNQYHADLGDKVPVVRDIELPGQSAAEIDAQVNLETKTVKELVELNIYVHEKTRFYCTVVLTKLSPGQRYWFNACTVCNKSTLPFGNGFRCPENGCEGTGAMPRYRLCYIGSDGTEDIEFVFFDRVGRELIGKPLLTILRAGMSPAAEMPEIIQAARVDHSTPRELSAIVSGKYRLVVSVTTKSFDPKVPKPSYQVHRIDAQYGKQSHSSVLRRGSGMALSSSTKQSGSALSSAGEELADTAGEVNAGASSSHNVTEFSDYPASTDGDGSTAILAKTPPTTPPSVAKPSPPQEPKAREPTSVQKSLFQDSPRTVQTEQPALPVVTDASDPLPPSPGSVALPVVTDASDPLPPSPGSVAVVDANSVVPGALGSPASMNSSELPVPVIEATNEKRRRGSQAKSQADGSAKKKKA